MKPPFESSLKVALADTMAELQRHQNACAQLRLEQRLTVPIGDVQEWCSKVSDQLRTVCDSLEGKVDQWRQKMAEKNLVIRRLHEKLKMQQRASKEDGSHTPRTPQPRAVMLPGGYPRSPSGQDVLLRNVSGESPRALRVGVESSPVVGSRTPRLASPQAYAEDRKPVEISQDLREDTDPIDPNENSGELDNVDEASCATPAGQAKDMLEGMCPSTPQQRLAGYGPSGVRMAEDRGGLRSRPTRTNPPPAATHASTAQRSSLRKEGPVGELKLQNTNFRREVANLRRQNAEMVNQLRARDGQIDQLTGTLRELQIVTQRQMELYKRQLSMKDESLQAIQDELVVRTSVQCGPNQPNVGPVGDRIRARRRVSDPQQPEPRAAPASRPGTRTEGSHRPAPSPRGKVTSTPSLSGASGVWPSQRRTGNNSVGPQGSGSRRSTSVDETSNRVRTYRGPRDTSANQGRTSHRKGPPSPAEELLGSAKDVSATTRPVQTAAGNNPAAAAASRKGRICWDPQSGPTAPAPTKRAGNP